MKAKIRTVRSEKTKSVQKNRDKPKKNPQKQKRSQEWSALIFHGGTTEKEYYFIYLHHGNGLGMEFWMETKQTQALSMVHNVISHTRAGAGGVAIKGGFRGKTRRGLGYINQQTQTKAKCCEL